MLKVVEKSKESESTWRPDALGKVLKEAHSLFAIFHGSIRALLEKEPGGGLARAHLYPSIMDYLSGKSFYTNFQVQFFHRPSFKMFHCIVTNCQHIKSGLHSICAAGVIPKLLYQILSIGFFAS